MNINAAKSFQWSQHDLWEYFGLGKGGESRYLLKLNFHPGIVAGAPKQMHETRIHPDGHYVFLDGAGYVKQKPEMEARCDGIDWEVMRDAVNYLKFVNFKNWNALELTYSRIVGETVDVLADRLGLAERSTVYYRLGQALCTISRFLHRYLETIVKSGT